MVNIVLAKKTRIPTVPQVAITELRNQLSEISAQSDELKAEVYEQKIELVKSTAVVETQKMILPELQGHFDDKKKA